VKFSVFEAKVQAMKRLLFRHRPFEYSSKFGLKPRINFIPSNLKMCKRFGSQVMPIVNQLLLIEDIFLHIKCLFTFIFVL